RPDLDEEEVEASVGQIDQDSLVRGKGTPVPTYPGRQVVDAQGNGHDQPFEIAVRAFGALRENFPAAGTEGLAQPGRVHRLCIVTFKRDRAGHPLLLTAIVTRRAMPPVSRPRFDPSQNRGAAQ